MQTTIEEAIIKINKFIIELNMENTMITPFTVDGVTPKGSRVKKYYEKLPDVLHPGKELKQKSGEMIANWIDTNFSKLKAHFFKSQTWFHFTHLISPECSVSPFKTFKLVTIPDIIIGM